MPGKTDSLPTFMMLALLAVSAAGCTTDDYDGCHGEGCLVDPVTDDDTIDPRPQFDAEGNPNFDEDGNYIGCHGLGCEVDNPDA